MGRIFVGVSEYGSLRGVHQYAEERAGLQLLAVLAIVNPQLPANERVTINEAQRPRASQSAFWNDYVRRGAPPAVVAARPFTSKHDGGPNDDQGRAFDLGGPGGSVISDRAHALVKAVGAEYGIHHTGAGFNPREKWHFEYVPGTARKLASAGPTQQEKKDQAMTSHLYRHPGGTIAMIDWSTGAYWGLAGPAYVELVRSLGLVSTDPIREIPANQWDFLMGRVVETRQHIAAQVWATPLSGWNGAQGAGTRLVGADRGGVAPEYVDQIATAVQKKLPVGSGGGVDTDTLVAKITTAVGDLLRGIFTKAGTK